MRRLLLAMIAACASTHEETAAPTTLTFTIEGHDAFVFDGIATKWGEDFVFALPNGSFHDDRTMGELAGIPMIDVWTEHGGIAIFDASPRLEPIRAIVHSENGVTQVTVTGGTSLVKMEHGGDFATPLRELAKRLADQGVVTQRAPAWAFEPIWETYGFEESWTSADVLSLVPVMKKLGIGSITLDSGWYGSGTDAWDAQTGDYPPNPDTVGGEAGLRDLVAKLHAEGFAVRLWWAPGVAAPDSKLRAKHPDWFLGPEHSSSDDTSDRYLDPTNADVRAFHVGLVEKLIDLGADGFKQDDIFEIPTPDRRVHDAYDSMFRDMLAAGRAKKADVGVTTCNCGVAQNVWAFAGQNMLVTSVPVGSKQIRLRAKTYHALNVGGAAVLSDHVELTRGDVGPDDLDKPNFYDSVDFASIVPLGLVLETKLRRDPGAHYEKWFSIYRTYRFFEWEWIDVPLHRGLETYALRRDHRYVESFFADSPIAGLPLVGLEPGVWYDVARLETGELLGVVRASSDGSASLAITGGTTEVVTLTPR